MTANIINTIRFAIASVVIRVLYALDSNVIVITFNRYNELLEGHTEEYDGCRDGYCGACDDCMERQEIHLEMMSEWQERVEEVRRHAVA